MLRDRQSKVLSLEPSVRVRIEAQIKEADELETAVREEWFATLESEIPLAAEGKTELWNCLRAYMAKAFKRHGVETMLLLDPSQF